MATQPFSVLYDYVLPYVPAVDTPLVDYHIRRVVREFARRTTLWRRLINFTTVAGTAEYLLQPYDAEICVPTGEAGTDGWQPFTAADGIALLDFTLLAGAEPDGEACLLVDSVSRFDAWAAVTAAEAFDVRVSVSSYTGGPSVEELGAHTPARVVFEFASGGETEVSLPDLLAAGAWEVQTGVVAVRVVPADFGADVGGMDYTESAAFCIEVAVAGTGAAVPPEVCGPFCDPHKIISVCIGDRPIPVLPESVRLPAAAWPVPARPQRWFSPAARILRLYPTPDAAYEVEVDVVCVLSLTHRLNVIPESFAVDYLDVLADGVVASLKQQAGKPWFDLQGAMIYGGRFAQSMRTIRAALRDGDQPNSSRFIGPRFGK